MYQVQVFDEEHEDDLSDSVNAFLATHKDIDLYDIKFATAILKEDDAQIYCFSAMVIFRDKEID